jgi:hypothetical protein
MRKVGDPGIIKETQEERRSYPSACVCVLGDSECWRSRLRVTSTGEIYNMYCGGNRNVGYQFMTTELELLEQL